MNSAHTGECKKGPFPALLLPSNRVLVKRTGQVRSRGSGDFQVDLTASYKSGRWDFAERVLAAGFWHSACEVQRLESGVSSVKRFISPITLWLGNRISLRPGSQSPAGSPRAELSLPGVVRERLAKFISPIALCLGTRVSWLLTPDAGICCQWSLGVPS
jgi:hypothetical protein